GVGRFATGGPRVERVSGVGAVDEGGELLTPAAPGVLVDPVAGDDPGAGRRFAGAGGQCAGGAEPFGGTVGRSSEGLGPAPGIAAAGERRRVEVDGGHAGDDGPAVGGPQEDPIAADQWQGPLEGEPGIGVVEGAE